MLAIKLVNVDEHDLCRAASSSVARRCSVSIWERVSMIGIPGSGALVEILCAQKLPRPSKWAFDSDALVNSNVQR